MVLGESFYCPYNENCKTFKCPKWNECTSLETKDSSKFNKVCPYYKEIDDKTLLEDTPCHEISEYLDGEYYRTYENFTKVIAKFITIEGNTEAKSYVWERLAFTNYVQFFLPTVETPNQTKKDIPNFKAFLETLDELKPDLVIVWGVSITKHFKRKYIQNLIDRLKVREDDYYIDISYHSKDYLIVNSYHPSDKFNKWTQNEYNFKEALHKAFNELRKNSTD